MEIEDFVPYDKKNPVHSDYSKADWHHDQVLHWLECHNVKCVKSMTSKDLDSLFRWLSKDEKRIPWKNMDGTYYKNLKKHVVAALKRKKAKMLDHPIAWIDYDASNPVHMMYSKILFVFIIFYLFEIIPKWFGMQ